MTLKTNNDSPERYDAMCTTLQSGQILTLNGRRYRLDEAIGAGAYGQVWAATDPEDRPVALKRVNATRMERAEPIFAQEWHKHLLQEIDFLSRLSAEEATHIVKLLDHGEADGQPVLVLERMEANLQQWVGRLPQPPTPRCVLDWMRKILAGLDVVHKHRLIYRDLKLSNVLMGNNGQILKLADFGTLKPQRDEGTVSHAGTLLSMAPEQRLPVGTDAQGRPVYDLDFRTDYYGLGLILLELFGQPRPASHDEIDNRLKRVGYQGIDNEPPLGGLDVLEQAKLAQRIRTALLGDATYAPAQDRSVAQALHQLIVRLLAPRKEDRPSSATEIRQALTDILSALPDADAASVAKTIPLMPDKQSESTGTGFAPAAKTPEPSVTGFDSPASAGHPHRFGWRYALPMVALLGLGGAFGYGWLLQPSPPLPRRADTAIPLPNPTRPPEVVPPSATPVIPETTNPGTTQPVGTQKPSLETVTAPTPEAALKPVPATTPETVQPVAVVKPAPVPGVAPVVAWPPARPVESTQHRTDRPQPTPAPPVSRSPVRDPLHSGDLAPEMVSVPGETIQPPGANGQPGHAVWLKPFELTAKPITYADYERFAKQTNRSQPHDSGLSLEERRTQPVMYITWDEAQAYLDWLSAQTGQHYRLPTEKEWLYAQQKNSVQYGHSGWEWLKDCADDGCHRRLRSGLKGRDFQPTDQGGRDITFRALRELNPEKSNP